MVPKVWVNQQLSSNKIKRRKKNKRSAYRRKYESKPISAEGRAYSAQNHAQINNTIQPNLVESFIDLAGKVDLLKISNKLAEFNQVMEQVNGLIHQFPFYKPPVQAHVPPEHVNHNIPVPYNHPHLNRNEIPVQPHYEHPSYQASQRPPYGYR